MNKKKYIKIQKNLLKSEFILKCSAYIHALVTR